VIEAAFFAVLLAVPEMDCAKYGERAYGRWTPSELAKTDRGIRLRLNEQAEPRRIADLFFDGTSWRQVIPADAEAARQRQFARERAREAHCQKTVPYRQPDQQTAIALRPHLRVGNSVEEKPAACHERDGVIWFGLGFYEGEGSDGVGGIGRYIPATKQIEVRRPEWLRDKSVDRIAFDGHDLWLAISQHYEKDEQPWGLVRYDWEHNELRPLAARDDAPCGFKVVDLLLESEYLWVATDLALSRLDRSTHTWRHWIPARHGTLRPGSCRPVYERAMNVASELWNCEAAFDTADLVARLAPEVARATILREPALHSFESSAAGMVAKNPQELRRMVRGADSAVVPQAMLAFAERKSRDPERRELAFSYAKRTGDTEPLRYFRDDHEIFEYLLSVARSNDQHRVHKAIRMLPWIGGRSAVRPLLSIVDVALDSNDQYKAITALEALERAAHLRIEADGRITELAANSDTPEYADEEFNAFMRFRTEIDELRKIAAQWHRRHQ
jgi:hypothetical protein